MANELDVMLDLIREEGINEIVVCYTLLAAFERFGSTLQGMSMRLNGKTGLTHTHVHLIILKKNLLDKMNDEYEKLKKAEQERYPNG